MSDEEVRAVVARCYEEIWNQGRLEVCDELIAPDLPAGPEGLKQTVAAVPRA